MFCNNILFFLGKFHHFILYQDKKEIYIFDKSNNFSNIGIYAMVIYFIVHFNA